MSSVNPLFPADQQPVATPATPGIPAIAGTSAIAGAPEMSGAPEGSAAPGAEATSTSEPETITERTGVPDVDAVLAALDELDTLPVSEHSEAYENAHRRLHQALLSVGDDQGA